MAHGSLIEISCGFADYANGYLAMIAVTGMLFQYGLTGSAWGDCALYTAGKSVKQFVCPGRLRTFEYEVTVKSAIGF